ncbi:MAG: UvrD-helicase domain-containing protein [Patescibacteria group bacterium]
MQDHLVELNEKQREAATHVSGPLLIVAGAGAGKTKTITQRIVNLISGGVAPENILAVTFTNKAAKEMRDRVIAEVEKLGGQSTRPFISTFHSLGVHIIKENARALGFNRHFTILDENDATALIKEAMLDLELDPKEHDPRRIRGIVSREKGNFVDSDGFRERLGGGASAIQRVVAQVWPRYERAKAKENSLDFDDLLLFAVKLLQGKREVREDYQERWQYIHVDEYQDTNEVQYLLTRLLSENHQNICVVGDADQNIYSWRGANLRNILHFEKDYPGAKIILLEENYRSTGNILDAANAVIKKNKFRPEKNLFTRKNAGEKISLYSALDETDEADFVATKILEMLDSSKRREDVLEKSPGSAAARTRGIFQQENIRAFRENVFSDIAVLYRANFQSRALEEAMLNYNIPYQVLGVKFFERKEIKDTLAYLRAALNPASLSDIKRIINFPRRGIGKATLAKIFSGDTESLPEKVKMKIENFYKLLAEIRKKIESDKASDVIKFTVKISGIEKELSEGTDEELEKLENIRELATLALKYDGLENGIEKLLEEAALASDQDSLVINQEKKESKNAVRLMTVHASKGLEFKYVFVVGLEEGLFPHTKSREAKTGEDSEEERRLFYVALTRAKEKLFLCYADYRTIFGSRAMNMPSEFILDVPKNLLEIETGEKIKTVDIDE